MHLIELELEEFRSYKRLALPLDARGLRLVGPNASGKSSLLEAIAMLATTRSPRSSSERDVIRWGSGEAFGVPPFARVRAHVGRRGGAVEIEIGLQTDPGRPGVSRKQIRLGGRAVRAMDAVGNLKAVLFSPEDVALVSGPPSGRRRYLDLLISQLDGAYLRALSRYGRVLAQRNGLLKSLARERATANSATVISQLAFWDGELVALGAAIVARRWTVVRRLAELSSRRFRLLSPGEELVIRYLPSVSLEEGAFGDGTDFARVQPIVAREFEDQLHRARGDELRRGVSLVGPHRDDLTFAVASADLATFGSRGQQRLAVVALKLAETSVMTELAGEAPVLLLDDVLSELDSRHRSFVISVAAEVDAQVVVTATDVEVLDRPDIATLPWVRIEGGTVLS